MNKPYAYYLALIDLFESIKILDLSISQCNASDMLPTKCIKIRVLLFDDIPNYVGLIISTGNVRTLLLR